MFHLLLFFFARSKQIPISFDGQEKAALAKQEEEEKAASAQEEAGGAEATADASQSPAPSSSQPSDLCDFGCGLNWAKVQKLDLPSRKRRQNGCLLRRMPFKMKCSCARRQSGW